MKQNEKQNEVERKAKVTEGIRSVEEKEHGEKLILHSFIMHPGNSRTLISLSSHSHSHSLPIIPSLLLISHQVFMPHNLQCIITISSNTSKTIQDTPLILMCHHHPDHPWHHISSIMVMPPCIIKTCMRIK